MKYPYTAPSASSACSDRIPLHASTTSSVVFDSTIVFPSRSTGIPATSMQNVADCAAKSCSGNAIAFITIAGSGIMKTRNASGNTSSRRNAAPRISHTSPASTTIEREPLQEQLRPDRPHDQHQQAAPPAAPPRAGSGSAAVRFSRSRRSQTK